jgi:hypothetical protein
MTRPEERNYDVVVIGSGPSGRTELSTWWAAIFDNMVSDGECEATALSFRRGREQVL